MRTEEEFEQFYRDTLEKKIIETEGLRKGARNNLFLNFIIPIVSIIALCVIFPSLLFTLFIILPVLLLFLKATYTYNVQTYRSGFGKSVVSAMVSFLDERLSYIPDKGILMEAVRISRLFEYEQDGESSNYVEGKLGETFIQFSEVNLNLGWGAGDTIFKGIFLIATFNKYFNGDYFVFSGYSSNPYSTTKDVIELRLEYPEFEKEFSTYGSDEIEGRYILTPSMMQRMLDFKRKVNNKVCFSFTRSRMFIAIGKRGATLFDPNVFHSVKYENLVLWNRYLQFAIGVVEEFQLNTRIWSKR